MFYRYFNNGYCKCLPLNNMYSGSIVLIGGSPAIKKERPEEVLRDSPIPIMAMNNAGTIVQPTFWVGGDKPHCYSPDILYNSAITKFAIITRRNEDCYGKLWKHVDNTIFFTCADEGYTMNNLFSPHKHIVWWQNTWWIALSLIYTLGFRKVYMAGSGFNITYDSQYSYKTSLSDKEVACNQRLYGKTAEHMLKHHNSFKDQGMELVNCTEPSALKSSYGYTPLAQAIEAERAKIPARDTLNRPHSRRDKL